MGECETEVLPEESYHRGHDRPLAAVQHAESAARLLAAGEGEGNQGL